MTQPGDKDLFQTLDKLVEVSRASYYELSILLQHARSSRAAFIRTYGSGFEYEKSIGDISNYIIQCLVLSISRSWDKSSRRNDKFSIPIFQDFIQTAGSRYLSDRIAENHSFETVAQMECFSHLKYKRIEFLQSIILVTKDSKIDTLIQARKIRNYRIAHSIIRDDHSGHSNNLKKCEFFLLAERTLRILVLIHNLLDGPFRRSSKPNIPDLKKRDMDHFWAHIEAERTNWFRSEYEPPRG